MLGQIQSTQSPHSSQLPHHSLAQSRHASPHSLQIRVHSEHMPQLAQYPSAQSEQIPQFGQISSQHFPQCSPHSGQNSSQQLPQCSVQSGQTFVHSVQPSPSKQVTLQSPQMLQLLHQPLPSAQCLQRPHSSQNASPQMPQLSAHEGQTLVHSAQPPSQKQTVVQFPQTSQL